MEITSVTADADRESHWITVGSTVQLSVGQWVRIKTSIRDEEGVNEYLAPRSFSEFSRFYQEKFNGIKINEIHQIAEISGNRIRFHSPIRTFINATYDFAVHTFNPLEEVGVEDISFHGSFLRKHAHDFGDRSLSDARRTLVFGGYSLVQFNRCVNSWIRRCSFVNVVRGYRSIQSANLSFYQLTTSGNRGHYSALIENSTSIWTGLIEDVTVDNDTYNHGPSITHNTSGNVYYYSDMDVSKNFDVHASNPSYDNLFDNGSGGHLHGSSGANSPPNHLNRCVIWNYDRLEARNGGNYTFWSYPFWLNPIIVGIHGVSDPVGRDYGINESPGTAVEPSSLFDAQLKVRTGSVSMWLSNLHTEWEWLRNTPLTVPTVLPKNKIDTVPLYVRLPGFSSEKRVDMSDYFEAKYDTSIDAYSATSSDEDVATVRVGRSNVTIKATREVPSGLVIQPFIKACQITVTATSTDGTTAKQKFTVRVWWWTR